MHQELVSVAVSVGSVVLGSMGAYDAHAAYVGNRYPWQKGSVCAILDLSIASAALLICGPLLSVLTLWQ